MPAPPPKTYPPLKLLTQKCYLNGPDPSYRFSTDFLSFGNRTPKNSAESPFDTVDLFSSFVKQLPTVNNVAGGMTPFPSFEY
jgi:hypothetical protein